ncbi:MAG: DUF370 domain-containing protein [Clostridia bacterium]|nr:DUF370 domain-containing protein [Clostridia bacterium]
MYVYLGQDKVICTREMIGIFDLDNTTVSKITRDMLRKAEQSGDAVTIMGDLPKSYVICSEKRGRQKIYISPVTPSTLVKRIRRKKNGSYQE